MITIEIGENLQWALFLPGLALLVWSYSSWRRQR